MYGIRKVKTFHGVKYAVVNLKTKNVLGKDGKTTKFFSKEIDVVETKDKVLVFDFTLEGLQQAREWKAQLK
jgi:hypothetical protein